MLPTKIDRPKFEIINIPIPTTCKRYENKNS